MQKLFSELDPHKKGYLTENDWQNAFGAFNWSQQAIVELKNAIQCAFSNCESAFEFFLTFRKDGQKQIGYPEFEAAVNSLTAQRFKREELQTIWKGLTDGGKKTTLDRYQFREHFDGLRYSGASTVRNGVKSGTPSATTICTQNSSSSTWERDIVEKVRNIILTSKKSFEEVFRDFDEDKNGYISQIEFRNAMRKLNLGLSSREIDKLLTKIDTNNDGKIDWQEFMAKFKQK